MTTPLEGDIESNAKGPKRVTGDEGSYTAHSLKDQIEADKYLTGKDATQNQKFPLRMVKFVPPGAT